jgi:hypothetical protein
MCGPSPKTRVKKRTRTFRIIAFFQLFFDLLICNSSIQDGGETVYWGLGSTDVETEVSPDMILSRQNRGAHRLPLGDYWREDRNRGTVLVLCPGIILSSNSSCNGVDIRCPFTSSPLIFTGDATYTSMTMYWCFV